MDRIRTAELILSLVFPADRAASIAGDFSERPLRFWIDVTRTALSGLWNDVTEHPVSLMMLAVRGCLTSAAASLSALCVALFATLPWDVIFAVFSGLKISAPYWMRETAVIWSVCATFAAQFLCQFQVGRGWPSARRGVSRGGPGRVSTGPDIQRDYAVPGKPTCSFLASSESTTGGAWRRIAQAFLRHGDMPRRCIRAAKNIERNRRMKARIAEWLLSLVVPADRATATIGDFAEDASTRGSFWFWSSILQVIVSGLWNSLAERPLHLMGLALRAWAVNLVAVFAQIVVLPFLMVMVLMPLTWLVPGIRSLPESVGITLGTVSGVLLWIAGIWLSGRWLARRAPTREVAACIALFLIQFLVINAVAAIVLTIWNNQIEKFVAGHQGDLPAPSNFWINFVYFVILLAAAIQTRRTSLQAR